MSNFSTKSKNSTFAALFVFLVSAFTTINTNAKQVLVNGDMNWDQITTGSGLKGVPTFQDDIIIYGTNGSGTAVLTINVSKAEAKSLTLGDGSNPRTGEVLVGDNNTLTVYGAFITIQPTHNKYNFITYGNTASQLIVKSITLPSYYKVNPSGSVTVNPSLITPTPLPVDLISFTAVKNNNVEAKLDWSTAWEVNNSGFEVERSTNGTSWTRIGFVQGNGDANHVINYSFNTSIAGIKAPVVYYRLKQVDFNGQFEYSSVRSIRLGAAVASAQSIYPNPAANKVTVDLGEIVAGDMARVTIMDMTGKIVMIMNQTATEGDASLEMNIENLKTGNYIVNVSTATANYNTKLIKL